MTLLASQSPDDFEGAEDGYLDNMGMTLAFNTQARPGPTSTPTAPAALLYVA